MRRWTPARLSWKLLLAILPPVIVAMSGIVWLQYNKERSEILVSINRQMDLLAQRTAVNIDELLDQRSRDLLTLSETPLIVDYYRNVDFKLADEAETYRKELERYLSNFAERSRVYSKILYLDREGRTVCRVGAAPAAARGAREFSAEDFAAASKVAPNGWWVSRIEQLPGTGPVLYYAKPIRDELGAPKGMLVLAYDLSQVQGLLAKIAGWRGNAYIRGQSGYRLEGRTSVREGNLLSVSRGLLRLPWTVVVEAPLDDFLGPLRSVRDEAVLTAVVGGLLLIAILLWLVRSITRPIEALVEAARAIGAGDLRRRVADVGTDELGTLSRAFNEMAERLERNRETQAALQSQLIQAEKLSAVGQLISSVAHELNNPLGAISGYAQILLLDAPPSRLRDDLAGIRQNVLRCQKVVDNLLFFVRKSGHERRKVDLNEAVDAALELLNYRLVKTEDVEVVRDLAVDLPPVIGDFQQIVQVLVNLVGNACDAMEGLERAEGKRLIVRTRAGTDRALVEVEDNGTGIPAEIVKHVFEPFFTTKPSGKGTGLGLPICLQIAREHGGDVTVESRPGRGTIFRIDLPPASHAELESDAADEAPPSLPPVPGRRVLVADDEKTIADLIARLLREDGDEAVVVLNGGDALRRLKEEVFDLVVSDIEMEQAKGQDLHAALKGADGLLRVPVVFITGDILNPKVMAFLSESGCEYLAKPFDIGKLMQLIRRVLSKRPAAAPSGGN